MSSPAQKETSPSLTDFAEVNTFILDKVIEGLEERFPDPSTQRDEAIEYLEATMEIIQEMCK